MNTTENLISNGCPAPAPQPTNNIVKAIKFPAQPQEWKIVSLRECPTPDNMQQCETPDQAAAYSPLADASSPAPVFRAFFPRQYSIIASVARLSHFTLCRSSSTLTAANHFIVFGTGW